MTAIPLWLANRAVHAGTPLALRDAWSGETIAEVAQAGPDEIEQAIGVEIDDRDAGTEALGKQHAAARARLVHEVDARLGGDVAKRHAPHGLRGHTRGLGPRHRRVGARRRRRRRAEQAESHDRHRDERDHPQRPPETSRHQVVALIGGFRHRSFQTVHGTCRRGPDTARHVPCAQKNACSSRIQAPRWTSAACAARAVECLALAGTCRCVPGTRRHVLLSAWHSPARAVHLRG